MSWLGHIQYKDCPASLLFATDKQDGGTYLPLATLATTSINVIITQYVLIFIGFNNHIALVLRLNLNKKIF